jgi:hypothetical protein
MIEPREMLTASKSERRAADLVSGVMAVSNISLSRNYFKAGGSLGRVPNGTSNPKRGAGVAAGMAGRLALGGLRRRPQDRGDEEHY